MTSISAIRRNRPVRHSAGQGRGIAQGVTTVSRSRRIPRRVARLATGRSSTSGPGPGTLKIDVQFMEGFMDRPTIEFKYDQSLRRHAIRLTGMAGLRARQLADIHGVLSPVQDAEGWTVYLKPNCCREATMQEVETTLGVTR